MTTANERRRSLIMAGGGSKVAFQAGVLQVWLDEIDTTFHHADAASGGVLNLAMWCQGMSGREIADKLARLPSATKHRPQLARLAATAGRDLAALVRPPPAQCAAALGARLGPYSRDGA